MSSYSFISSSCPLSSNYSCTALSSCYFSLSFALLPSVYFIILLILPFIGVHFRIRFVILFIHIFFPVHCLRSLLIHLLLLLLYPPLHSYFSFYPLSCHFTFLPFPLPLYFNYSSTPSCPPPLVPYSPPSLSFSPSYWLFTWQVSAGKISGEAGVSASLR